MSTKSSGKRGAATRRSPPGQAAIRKAIIETALAMSRTGLSPGRSGNVSARFDDGMLITPSGMADDILKPADITYVAADGSTPKGARKPSSEWRFHLSAYQARPNRAAVVHTHSLHATALACAHKPIPAFHYMVAAAGGTDIPLIPYAPFGTGELADHVATGLKDRDALLMANHGQIAFGPTLEKALWRAGEVELLCQQYAIALTLGEPAILSEAEMAEVIEKFATYGKQPASDTS